MTDFEERLLKALERIADALDKVVEEPPPFIVERAAEPAPVPVPRRSSLLPE